MQNLTSSKKIEVNESHALSTVPADKTSSSPITFCDQAFQSCFFFIYKKTVRSLTSLRSNGNKTVMYVAERSFISGGFCSTPESKSAYQCEL